MKRIKVIIIGGSAGSFISVSQILSELKPDFNIPIFLCLHRLKNISTGFEEALNIKSSHKVQSPKDKEVIKKGKIYLAPANYHMLGEIGNTIALSVDNLHKFSRPSIDLAFDSFSYIYKESMLGIILSGANSDGAEGLHKAFLRGSYTIAQDPMEAPVKTMPQSAISLFKPNQVLQTKAIVSFLNQLD